MNGYVLYDYLQVAGGAERLSLDLAAGLPGYRLVVSRKYPEAEHLSGIADLGPQRLLELGTPLTRVLGRIPEAIASFKYGTRFLGDADIVVYSGLYAPYAVGNQLRGRRVYYCHTPPRYVYDWRERYLLRLKEPIRSAAATAIDVLRRDYEASLRKMNVIVANSENVRGRLKRYIGLDAEVAYPPVDTDRFRWLDQGDYFISLARLEPHKRVDAIVRAFLAMPSRKLIVASGGSDESRLRRLAAGARNVIFVGWQGEERLRELVGRARAAIYVPVDEDFGMSPVEAMSAGKPVIGVAEGGLRETVIDGETGILATEDVSPQAIVDAVEWMTAGRALSMRAACEAQAAKFSKRGFLNRMRTLLGE